MSSQMNIDVVKCYENAFKNRENDHEGYVVATKKLFQDFINIKIPVFERPTMEPVKTSRELLVDFLNQINPYLLKMSAPVMGSLLSYIINPTEENKPGDIDIWIPHNANTAEFFAYLFTHKWISMGLVDIDNMSSNKGKMSPDIISIRNFYSLEYEFKIQLINLKTNITTDYVRDRFDFEASKGVYSPFIHSDGKPIGFRATKPEVIEAIKTMTTEYCEHEWDLIKTGGKPTLDPKSINRLRKYQKKGYTIIASSKSIFTTDELYEFMNNHEEKPDEESQASYYENDYVVKNIDKKYVMAILIRNADIYHSRISRIIENNNNQLFHIKQAYNLDVKPYEEKLNVFYKDSFASLVKRAIKDYESYKNYKKTFIFNDDEITLSKLRRVSAEKKAQDQKDVLTTVHTEEIY